MGPNPGDNRDAALGERIRLVRFDEGFITDAYLSWLDDPELMRHSRQRFVRHDSATSREYLAEMREGSNRFWAVVRPSDGLFVGTVTARVATRDLVADLGILIGHPDARGTGLGREAWGLAMRYMFTSERIRKITAGTSALNIAMLRIVRHWRMPLEGTLREQELVDGRPTDVLLFGMLRSEWQVAMGIEFK